MNLLCGSKYYLLSDYCFHCIPAELICVRKLPSLSGLHKHMSGCKFCSIINCDKNICKNGNIPIIFTLDNHLNLIRAKHITINYLVVLFNVFTILCGSLNRLINKILRYRCTCKSENLMKSIMFWPTPLGDRRWGMKFVVTVSQNFGHCKD